MVILNSMKTAISIPDSIFQSADDLAKRLGLSRSELYVKAISQFLAEHKRENITGVLNKVYGEIDSSLGKHALSLQIRSIRGSAEDTEEW